MYEDRQGQRITMYLRGMAMPTPETAFRFAEQGLINTFYWVEGDWGYAQSGELPRAHLLGIAHTIHRQLSIRVPQPRVGGNHAYLRCRSWAKVL